MQITSTTPRQAPAAPKFNYNAQDPDVLNNDTVSVSNLNPNGGHPSTDTVVLDNKKAVFVFGQLVGFRPDPNYKLNPDQDGNFNYPAGHATFTGGNVFGAASATIDKVNSVRQELVGKPIEWAFGEKQLHLSPETGEWPNAFYARQLKGLHFFDYKTTSTGDSGEVVSHEAGHAILDALRPGYMEGSGSETGAFHEAFGDAVAMLMTLGNDQAVEKIVAQTEGGDLSSKRNLLSDMGEAFGHALGREGGIRTAFNSFTYQDPATLPEQGDEDHLGREVHDFSRLWSGAFYDVLDGISDANRAAGMTPQQALKAAGDEGWKLLVAQMESAPANSETTFKEMAQNLMAGDAQFNAGSRQQLIKDVMVKRELMEKDQAPTKTFRGPSEVRQESFVFGQDAGALAGVKMTTTVDRPMFGMVEGDDKVASEAEKGARLMVEDGKVLFTDRTPELGDLIKQDGTVFTAYVAPNAEGEREFKRVPIAF